MGRLAKHPAGSRACWPCCSCMHAWGTPATRNLPYITLGLPPAPPPSAVWYCPALPCRRYREAFAALAEAKRLHKVKHNYTDKNYTRSFHDVMALFPLPGSDAAAGAAAAAEPAQAEGDGASLGSRATDAVAPAPASSHAALLQLVQRTVASSGAWLRGLLSGLAAQLKHGGAAPSDSTAAAAAAEEPAPAAAAAAANAEEAASGRGDAGEMIPIFVVGMPRSGSTLIEQILARQVAWFCGSFRAGRELWNAATLAMRRIACWAAAACLYFW
jgi:hypothetical protein